jgi:hypothetical protein
MASGAAAEEAWRPSGLRFDPRKTDLRVQPAPWGQRRRRGVADGDQRVLGVGRLSGARLASGPPFDLGLDLRDELGRQVLDRPVLVDGRPLGWQRVSVLPVKRALVAAFVLLLAAGTLFLPGQEPPSRQPAETFERGLPCETRPVAAGETRVVYAFCLLR